MLDLLQKELENRGVFQTPIPKFLVDLTKTIPNERIPEKMKLTIAVSEFILFMSQFRRNILIWNNSLIPINAITFIMSGSGSGKDSSVNVMRKAYQVGYDLINNQRKLKAIENAIKIAKSKRQANADNEDVYSKFYTEPTPLFVSPSTNEGFIQYLNELDDAKIGAGFIYSGEFSSELNNSSVIMSNLQLLSELYDEGKKEVKVLKNKENQSREIKNLPVSALFVSSPENILFDETNKKLFKLEFTSKLARRSFFNYSSTPLSSTEYSSIKEMLREEMVLEDEAREITTAYELILGRIAEYQLEKKGLPLALSHEAREIFMLYKRYNQELSETIKKQYPICKIVRLHMQWKALKLSGAIALFNKHEIITEQDYKEAIAFTELLSEDMLEFETELVKEPYELFVSLVQTLLEENKAFINIHSLKKLGYIQGSSNIAVKLKELATLAGSYDLSGVYNVTENGIEYSKIIKTNHLGISYVKVSGTKEQRSMQCSKGFNYAEIEFKDLADMLNGDYAYSPFKFKDGVRGKANIEGGTKWIALDIDKSLFTDEQTHFLLSNFNHHIVRTSDKDNPYKFRVLLELDSFIDLDDKTYKAFIQSIKEYLSLDADVLPKSQIFFSYAGRTIFSVIDKEPIEIRPHLIQAYSQTAEKKTPISNLNKEQRQALIDDPLETFRYAFEAKEGEGSLCLIRAAKHAKDLGMSIDKILELMEQINEYWDEPMPQARFEQTILNQIRRWDG